MKKIPQSINCPICNGQTKYIDVVDFNKNCVEIRGKFLPLSGIPIYYTQCQDCLFAFAPEFLAWSEMDFLEKIYNDEYIEIDPDYLENRPRANSQLLSKLFGDKKEFISHLDYGGGSGKLSSTLRSEGWLSKSYDPFPKSDVTMESLGKFNLISAFEVFEHVPDVNSLMHNLIALMSENCFIIFSTLTLEGNISKNGRITWWYASPRNGHISLFTKKSLSIIASKYGLNFGSFNDGLHCFFNQAPNWSRHLIK